MACIYLVVLRIENEKNPRRLLFNSREEAVEELAWWEDNERCEFATLAMVRYVDDFLDFATAGHKQGPKAISNDPTRAPSHLQEPLPTELNDTHRGDSHGHHVKQQEPAQEQ